MASPSFLLILSQLLVALWASNAFHTSPTSLSTTRIQQSTTLALHVEKTYDDADKNLSSHISDQEPALTSRRETLKIGSLVGLVSLSLPTTAVAADTKALGEEYRQGTAALADMDDLAPVPREAYIKLDSGVVFADMRPGSGETVKDGSRVNLQWVLRKSNGYFVDSSHVSNDVPFIFVVGDGSAIQGVDEGVRGMKVGGVRRILIPPRLAYTQGLEDGKPGPLPQGFGPRQQMRRIQEVRKDVPGEYVFLEVQVTRVR